MVERGQGQDADASSGRGEVMDSNIAPDHFEVGQLRSWRHRLLALPCDACPKDWRHQREPLNKVVFGWCTGVVAWLA